MSRACKIFVFWLHSSLSIVSRLLTTFHIFNIFDKSDKSSGANNLAYLLSEKYFLIPGVVDLSSSDLALR